MRHFRSVIGREGRIKIMFFSLFRLVGLLEKATAYSRLIEIFKNLQFKKQETGRGAREYGVNTSETLPDFGALSAIPLGGGFWV